MLSLSSHLFNCFHFSFVDRVAFISKCPYRHPLEYSSFSRQFLGKLFRRCGHLRDHGTSVRVLQTFIFSHIFLIFLQSEKRVAARWARESCISCSSEFSHHIILQTVKFYVLKNWSNVKTRRIFVFNTVMETSLCSISSFEWRLAAFKQIEGCVSFITFLGRNLRKCSAAADGKSLFISQLFPFLSFQNDHCWQVKSLVSLVTFVLPSLAQRKQRISRCARALDVWGVATLLRCLHSFSHHLSCGHFTCFENSVFVLCLFLQCLRVLRDLQGME